ncbi:MAG: excinuclease ABC subunit UvrC [Clostridia bacterium]|nr:excinuclease ABC subunit UvrC [Clostridia bacterium]
MFNLEEELKNLPEQPGVYIMHNKDGEIIYVGKAKILKNRVRQYFQKNKNHSPKVLAMVSNIAYFEYIVTDTEIEALVLECNLIKKHRPKYNILLKDDKQYPYIKVTINEEYPRIFMSRTLKKDGAKYFGPYASMQTVKGTIDIVQKIFKIPLCRRSFPDDIGKGRPCLNYHIDRCFAPCIFGKIFKDEYRKIFFEICSFLEGNHEKLISDLTDKMAVASKNTEYEKAAALRDKISAIKNFEEKQKVINANKQTDTDVIAFYMDQSNVFAEIFYVRMGRITGRKSYRIDAAKYLEPTEFLSDFLKQYYAESDYIPSEILLQEKVSDEKLISEWLGGRKGKKVAFTVPQKGYKKSLVDMVKKNAEISAENYRISGLKLAESRNKITAEIAKKLKLEHLPIRIESYDISNIQGADNVASMVVFVNGKPSKKDYRNFNIKSVDGANDYLAMQEVIYRRFRHAKEEENLINKGEMESIKAKFLPLPDLILLDGGKGHLSSVLEIMESIDVDVPVFGMVKDNKHKTRGLISKDGEVSLSPTDSVFRFIVNVQEEVHKTAIGYHRNKRSKRIANSELDEIKGIGKAKKSKLLTHFKSVQNIKNADISELEKVIDRLSAKNVYEHFNSEG